MKTRTEMIQDGGIKAVRAKKNAETQRTRSSAFSSAVTILNLIEGEVRSVMGGIIAGKYQNRTFLRGMTSMVVLVLSLAFCLTFAVNADAATAGPRNPSSASNNNSIGSRSWSSVTNVYSSNNSNASATSLTTSSASNYLVATGFGFSIPAGSTINGIEVSIERRDGGQSSSRYIRDNSIKIVKGGTITGTEHANTTANWPTSDAYATYGSTTDLWGTTWTTSDINASNFGVAISAKGSSSSSETAYIDHVRITITYTAAAACTAAAPTVTLTPASQTITTNAGSVTYSATIRNNDTGAGCSSVTYTLAPSDTNTTAFNASTLSSTSVSLAPGATSGPVTLTVGARSGQTTGTNTTTVTASAAGHANGSSSVTTTLNVQAVCTASTPILQISPVSRSISAGGTTTYNVTVINNDTAACAASTFALSVVSDSNSANFNTPSTLNPINLSIGPGLTGTSTLTVSARATAALNAANATVVRVTAAGHSSPADVTATTVVAAPGASLLHNSITTNSSKWAAEGGWGIAGGKYGEFVCSTCHTEDTTNIKRVKTQITVPDTSKGNIPGSTVNFQSTSGPNSFGDDTGGHATSSKICEVCHSQTSVHKYNQPTYIGHESPAASDCTACHKHNKGFKPAGGCTICHNMQLGNRVAIVGQFSANSHHVQGVELTDQHCYQCHWEANSDGSINTAYHGGAAASGAPVNLVIYGAGLRPSTYTVGTTAVEYSANGQRAELQKINSHCLGCHSAQNNTAQPFGDGKTPKQYAWDNTSVAERYSQTGSTIWGKYTTYVNAAQKNIAKAFSAHGNAGANARGWSTTTGVDGAITNTSGSVNVLCFDCHNSHGSSVSGKTTSYASATPSGGILKDTLAGKGGYAMTYKPVAGGSAADKNAHNAGAAICFDCHLTQNAGTKPWGYQGTYGSTQALLGYFDSPYFGPGLAGPQQRFAYKALNTRPKAGHFGVSSPLTPGRSVMGTIEGLCTPCHDPHGVSPTLGTNQGYGVPLLKGTWMTSPYKEDKAPLAINERRGVRGEGRDVVGYSASSTPGYRIDQNTFEPDTLTTTQSSGLNLPSMVTWPFTSTRRVTETPEQFAGLCLRCHPQTSIRQTTGGAWKSLDRVHNTVKGWGGSGANANNAVHSFTCSKCHSPHNAALGRLLITNCIDYSHRGQRASGGAAGQATVTDKEGSGNGRFPGGGGGRGTEGSYAYFFGTTTSGGRACHDNTNTTAWPGNQYWNTKSPW